MAEHDNYSKMMNWIYKCLAECINWLAWFKKRLWHDSLE